MPSCDECKGACCESFALPLNLSMLPPDVQYWVRLHATHIDGNDHWFECRCTKLGADGRCTIYDRRPEVCVRFPVGGPDCLQTRRERRGGE